MKKHWFYLMPDVYVRQANGSLLFYHTRTGKRLVTTSPLLRQLVDEVYRPDNNGATTMALETFKEEERQLLKHLTVLGFAAIREIQSDKPRPMVLLPILNLQRDLERLSARGDQFVGKDVMGYLTELTLQLQGDSSSLLPVDVDNLLRQARYSSVKNIHIKGHVSEQILEVLRAHDFHYYFWTDYRQPCRANVCPNLNAYTWHIEINFPVNVPALKHCLAMRKDGVTVEFFIKSAEEYEQAEQLADELGIARYHLTPVFDGNNLAFFKEYIFMDEADLFASLISHRHIFCNQKLNANYFGKLFVQSDGSVKASPLTEAIGNIHNDSLVKVIYKELVSNTAWRWTRTMSPCKDCLFQYLCPPPSDYERQMHIPNMCHIHKG